MQFSRIKLIDVHRDVIRNIVSIRSSQDLFDDLSDNPDDWALAQGIEKDVRPYSYQSKVPIIDRPFEEAEWLNAINWPFTHWQASRFSDGSFGVWYGCGSAETTIYETTYHWFTSLLRDAGFDQHHEPVIGERKLYNVACDAALLDLRAAVQHDPKLAHPTDYRYAQSVGARLHREGHPGLITPSVRHLNEIGQTQGDCYAIFNTAVLSNPRQLCQVTYRLEHGRIVVEKQTGVTWVHVSTAQW